MRVRIEKDSLGEKELPQEAYYGITSLRDHDNIQIFKKGINRQMIKGLAIIKKAAAKANQDATLMSPEKTKVIMLSCDEILNGRLHGQFITDVVQGGSGAGMNMNANEVIANRANEMKGFEKGSYTYVHPIDDVNLNLILSGRFSGRSIFSILSSIFCLLSAAIMFLSLFQRLCCSI